MRSSFRSGISIQAGLSSSYKNMLSLCGRWRNGGWRQLPETRLYGEYGLVNLVQLIRKHLGAVGE
jgi:hypothetical protein